jgi:hypothetical protein
MHHCSRGGSGLPRVGGTGDMGDSNFWLNLRGARALGSRARRVLPRRKLLNRRLKTAGARRRGREQFNTDASGHLPRWIFLFVCGPCNSRTLLENLQPRFHNNQLSACILCAKSVRAPMSCATVVAGLWVARVGGTGHMVLYSATQFLAQLARSTRTG